MIMPATVTLAQLADISHDVNTVGNAILGEVVRDRPNQRALVLVSDMDDTEFGIYTTSELLKMFSALETEIKVEVVEYESKPVNMLFTDSVAKAVYILSDPAIIPKSATPKKMPDWNVEMDLSTGFIDTYVKSKNALSETTSLRIMPKPYNRTVNIALLRTTISTMPTN